MAGPRDEITALLYAYAERIDAGDFEGVADLFTDAELSFEGHGVVRRGRDEVLAQYAATTRCHEDGTPRTKHLVTNVVVDVDEQASAARARSYFTVLQAVPGQLALQPIVAGRYRDRFTRIDGAWRFAARHIVVDLVGDVSAHLHIDLGDPS